MEANTLLNMFNFTVGPIVLLYWARLLFDWLVAPRYFPRYAAKQRLKARAKLDAASDKRRRKREAKVDRVDIWAHQNLDDPVSRRLLQVDVEGADIQSQLAREQAEADAYKVRREQMRIQEQESSDRMLDWAIQNPETPEGNRHLCEVRRRLSGELSSAERSVEHCKTMLSFSSLDDEERAEYSSRLTCESAGRDELRLRIAAIDQALLSTIETTEQ